MLCISILFSITYSARDSVFSITVTVSSSCLNHTPRFNSHFLFEPMLAGCPILPVFANPAFPKTCYMIKCS